MSEKAKERGHGWSLDPADESTENIVLKSVPERDAVPAALLVLRGSQVGRVYPIGERVVLGRGSQANVHVDDPGASRMHARVERRHDGQFQLFDLRSHNGTRVNGERVAKHDLHLGDRIDIGSESSFRFIYQDEVDAHLQRVQKLEAVGQLAGGIAHEFNNLLAVILGNLSALWRQLDTDDPTVRESLDDCIGAARRGAGLTRDLLSFARHGEVELKPIDLGGMAQRVLSILRRTVDRSIEIRGELPDGLVVMADAAQLQQVFLNLALNARDAMPDGGVLQFSADRVAAKDLEPRMLHDAESWVRIRVQDSGTGMSDEVMARIFEPFYTTKDVGQGTGLGLALAHGIARAHNGDISVESKPGEGTTFTVLLPATSELAHRTVPTEVTAETPTLSGMVLVIDDEPAIRRLAERLLKEIGFEVIGASDGDSAVEALREHSGRVTHALLDVNMPHRDGESAYHEMLAIAPTLRVVVCSGDPTDERVARLKAAGAAGWLAKPYEMSELARVFSEVE